MQIPYNKEFNYLNRYNMRDFVTYCCSEDFWCWLMELVCGLYDCCRYRGPCCVPSRGAKPLWATCGIWRMTVRGGWRVSEKHASGLARVGLASTCHLPAHTRPWRCMSTQACMCYTHTHTHTHTHHNMHSDFMWPSHKQRQNSSSEGLGIIIVI